MRSLSLLKFALLLLFVAAVPAAAGTLVAVEYYNATLDHYFVTAAPDEIAKLDRGEFVGWQRTQQSFNVFDPATPVAGASAVCRFYGKPSAGLDSHFYSASAAECQEVRRRFAGVWDEETANAFGIFLPDLSTGQCPATTVPVYRSWNSRADSNHRFTTDPAIQQAMLARGYIAEGYGPGPLRVAMCAPADGSTGPGPVPSCTLSTPDATPNVGSAITITATCSNAPASFAWTGCLGSGTTCTATSSTAGQATYSVVAHNAAGSSVPASIAVNWQATTVGTARCWLARTSQTDPPVVNSTVVLKLACDKVVAAYVWNGCSSSSNVCLARESTPGVHTYSVFTRSSAGSSTPVSVTLNWVASAPTPPGLCGQFASYLYSDVGSESSRVESAAMPNAPAFAWNGAWAVSFAVPATIGSRLGRLSAAEFAGQRTDREATISRTACDFRPTDPSGVNGPIARAFGSSTTNFFTADPSRAGYPVLQAGRNYYYNLRNYEPSTGSISCAPSTGRCDAFVESLLPK
jgi:hypothetical protein